MDKIMDMMGDKLPAEVKAAFPDGLPDISKLQSTVAGMDQAQVSSAAKTALQGVDQAKLKEFGAMMQEGAAKSGKTLPAGVATGNSADIADMFAGLAKGEGGLGGALQQVQDLSGGGGMLDGVLDKVSGGQIDIIKLLQNPKIAAVLIPLVKQFMGMAK